MEVIFSDLRRIFHRLFCLFWDKFTWLLFRTFTRYVVVGRECVLPYGPLIVASNHLSLTDPSLLCISIGRHIHWMAKADLNWFFRLLAWGYQSVPVHRGSSSREALEKALNLLGQDFAVGVFPEGVRSTGKLGKGKFGAAMLAVRSGAPILPIAITGTERLRSKKGWFTRPTVKINIGQPFTPPILEGPVGRDQLTSVVDMIMERIAILLPSEYRGYYAFQEP